MESCSDSAHCGVHRAGFILVPWQPFDVVLLSIFRVATCICVSIVIMISHIVSL